jgi:hypothetical protein
MTAVPPDACSPTRRLRLVPIALSIIVSPASQRNLNPISQSSSRSLSYWAATRKAKRNRNLSLTTAIGVAEEHAYSVKKIDSDYFEEA